MASQGPTSKKLLLQILLNRSGGDISTPPFSQVKEAGDFQQLQIGSLRQTELEPLIHQYRKTLPKIHYSWLNSYLLGIGEKKRQALSTCLEEIQKAGMSRLNKELPLKTKPAPLLRKFYLKQLYQLIPLNQHLPIEYLPESPLNRLLTLQKRDLIELIDFLGIYDLAYEIRHILATKNLKNLYTCLTAKQQQFLRSCLHYKDKTISPPLHLDKWDGKAKSLFHLLHHRGLARMALALAGQHEDLIWYLSHFLDTGRGKLLLKRTKNDPLPHLTEAAILQLETAINFLKKDNS